MKEVVTPDMQCPCCQSVNDRATNPNEEREPNPGDLTICLHCAFLGVFDRTDAGLLTVRLPTSEEEAKYKNDVSVRMVKFFVEQDIAAKRAANAN